MDNNEYKETYGIDEQQQETSPVDFSDDSGEIHTVYDINYSGPEDGWQPVNHIHTISRPRREQRYVKGHQVNVHYETDDYRVVAPAYVIATIIVILFAVGAWAISPAIGIIVTIFAIAWIAGMWKQSTTKKWKNQHEKLQQEQMRQEQMQQGQMHQE